MHITGEAGRAAQGWWEQERRHMHPTTDAGPASTAQMGSQYKRTLQQNNELLRPDHLVIIHNHYHKSQIYRYYAPNAKKRHALKHGTQSKKTSLLHSKLQTLVSSWVGHWVG